MKNIIILSFCIFLLVPFVNGEPFDQMIDVDTGWNDLDFQILPTNDSVENVLMSVNGSYQMLKGIQSGKRVVWHENMPLHARTLTYFDFDGEYQVKMKDSSTIIITGYPDPNSPYLLNTSWSEWFNLTQCNVSDSFTEIKELVQYDYNSIVDNETFNETSVDNCDYCVVSVINSSWSEWSNVTSVLPNGTQVQSRNRTEYDSNDCYSVTELEDDLFVNQTYFESQTLYYGIVIDDIDISNADPTIGDVTSVPITIQISDLNGVDDIDVVRVEFVSGSPTEGDLIESNMRSECSNIDSDTIECSTSYDMQFYDDPEEYIVNVYTSDRSLLNDSMNNSFDYSSLVALELDVNSLAFGSLDFGSTKEILGDLEFGSGNATIKNQGNVMIDSDVMADDFVSLNDSFSISYVSVRFGLLPYFSLSNEYITETNLNLDYGISKIDKVDFKITVPYGLSYGTYTSDFNIIAVSS